MDTTESPLRPRGDEPQLAPETTLEGFVERLESAARDGDIERAASLLENGILEAWYGLGPERLRALLATVVSEGVPAGGIVAAMHAFLTPHGGADAGGTPAGSPEHAGGELLESAREHPFAMVMHMFDLRLQGRPVEAMHVAAALRASAGGIRPLYDDRQGWALFAAVQHGITAMLAGDFAQALASFTEAQLQPPPPSLAFLARDACVKAAIIHAVLGDRERARVQLGSARDALRTSSWVEPVIDAHAALVTAIIDSTSPEQAVAALEAIPLRAVGELWPYYVTVLHQSLVEAGQRDEARRRIQLFEQLQLPRVAGQGFTGSALALPAAVDALALKGPAEAREALAGADADLPMTLLLTGVLELVSGRPREALRLMAEVRARDAGLRMLQLWRLSIVASAHLALGEPDDARDTLRYVLRLLGGLRERELCSFSREVRDFAETHVEGWPVSIDVPSYFDELPAAGEPLTERELAVLRDLAKGLTRAEIAAAHFISINTLKTQLQSVYRKLGVNSRAGAAREAERRGLI